MLKKINQVNKQEVGVVYWQGMRPQAEAAHQNLSGDRQVKKLTLVKNIWWFYFKTSTDIHKAKNIHKQLDTMVCGLMKSLLKCIKNMNITVVLHCDVIVTLTC